MAKGDSTGIAQQGAQLDPNRYNRFGNPNNPVFGGQPMPGRGMGAQPSIAGPPQSIWEMLMEMMMGKAQPGSPAGNAGRGAGKIQQGIQRLKGPNQKPEMNKNPPRMPLPQARPPQSQMMPSGGQFMLPQPRIQDFTGAMNGGFQPPPTMMGGNNLQNPAFLQQLMAGGGGPMRNFV